MKQKKILFLSFDVVTISISKRWKKCGINICNSTDDIASTKIETFHAIVFDIIYHRSDHSAKEIVSARVDNIISYASHIIMRRNLLKAMFFKNQFSMFYSC